MNYGDFCDVRCDIALRDFEAVGQAPVPADLTVPPNKRMKAKELYSDDMYSDGLEQETDGNTIATSVPSAACAGNYFSKHGVSFSSLLADAHLCRS